MRDEVINKRIKAVRQQLGKNGIGCFVMTKPANVTYTTGFSGDDSWVVVARRKY